MIAVWNLEDELHVGQTQLETLQHPQNLENPKLQKKSLDLNLDAIRLDAIRCPVFSTVNSDFIHQIRYRLFAEISDGRSK